MVEGELYYDDGTHDYVNRPENNILSSRRIYHGLKDSKMRSIGWHLIENFISIEEWREKQIMKII